MEFSEPSVGSPREEDHPRYPISTVLAFLLLAILFGGMIGTGLAYLVSTALGIDLNTAIQSLDSSSPRIDRDLVRFANLVSHLFTFTLPVLFVCIFLYRKRWLSILQLDKAPILANILLGTFFILAAFPVAQFAIWLNQQIPLPEWMIQKEDAANEMIKGILTMKHPVELIFTLFVVAVLPAIGEELVFRGMLQQQLQRLVKPILAIWITAIIFSAIHFQFEGFIARMILGAVLGYLFYWTNNLWVPIIAHFVTNGIQVIGQYVSDGQFAEIEIKELEFNQLMITVFAAVILFTLGYLIKQRNTQHK